MLHMFSCLPRMPHPVNSIYRLAYRLPSIYNVTHVLKFTKDTPPCQLYL